MVEDAAADPRWVDHRVQILKRDLLTLLAAPGVKRVRGGDVPATVDGCQELLDRACSAGLRAEAEYRFGGVDAASVLDAELEERRRRLARAGSTFIGNGGWLEPPSSMADSVRSLRRHGFRCDPSRMVNRGAAAD